MLIFKKILVVIMAIPLIVFFTIIGILIHLALVSWSTAQSVTTKFYSDVGNETETTEKR